MMKAFSKVKLTLIILISCLSISAVGLVFACYNPFNENDITPRAGVYISSAEEFLQELEWYGLDGDYYIEEDIDLAGRNWTPIGTMAEPFTGSFIGEKDRDEGRVVTIKNLTITLTGQVDRRRSGNVTEWYSYNNWSGAASAYRFDGFFGIIKGATIKNIRFENVKYTFDYYGGFGVNDCNNLAMVSFGTICGRAYGTTTIENCEVRGLEVNLKYLNGGAQNTLFRISGLVGYTFGIGAGKEKANAYSLYEVSTNLSESSYPVTNIKNVILCGTVAINCDGGNNQTKANLTFCGIAGHANATSTTGNSVQAATVNVNNACFIPQTTNFCTFKQTKAWNTSWTEGSNWHRISSESYLSVYNPSQCCTNENEIKNLNVCYNAYFLDEAYSEGAAFFYDSSIKYTNGTYTSTSAGDKVPVLLNTVEYMTEHEMYIIDDFGGLSSVSYNSSYIAEYYRNSDYVRAAPCKLVASGLNTKKLKLGDAELGVNLKTGYETTGWQLEWEDNDYVCYVIEIIPEEITLQFDLPTNVDGITYNTTPTTIYVVSYVASISVYYEQLADYTYQLTYTFVDASNVTRNIVYSIPKKYISKEFDLNQTETIQVKRLVSATGSFNILIIPQFKLKMYGYEFT